MTCGRERDNGVCGMFKSRVEVMPNLLFERYTKVRSALSSESEGGRERKGGRERERKRALSLL